MIVEFANLPVVLNVKLRDFSVDLCVFVDFFFIFVSIFFPVLTFIPWMYIMKTGPCKTMYTLFFMQAQIGFICFYSQFETVYWFLSGDDVEFLVIYK